MNESIKEFLLSVVGLATLVLIVTAAVGAYFGHIIKVGKTQRFCSCGFAWGDVPGVQGLCDYCLRKSKPGRGWTNNA